MKHKKLLCGLIGLLVVGFALLSCVDSWYHKPQNVFERNKDLLNDIAEQYMENGNLQYPTIAGIEQVTVWNGTNPIIEFMTSGFGIAPGSQYYGFYYSVNGTPVAYQGTDVKLELQDDGWWEWHGNGDNGGRTKQIEGNWYIFEAHF